MATTVVDGLAAGGRRMAVRVIGGAYRDDGEAEDEGSSRWADKRRQRCPGSLRRAGEDRLAHSGMASRQARRSGGTALPVRVRKSGRAAGPSWRCPED
ncbi:hypothetical protein ABEV34_00625 [Methylorubrum rhodesianum]|uniref:Uncharacterized protein n=2 Tax=Methylorubrum rhodesianum TaxID=29427 RepID=A0ABU9Z6L5_9HYPH|nr:MULTISPECIES: hypothetical protein [Methylorubrum]